MVCMAGLGGPHTGLPVSKVSFFSLVMSVPMVCMAGLGGPHTGLPVSKVSFFSLVMSVPMVRTRSVW